MPKTREAEYVRPGFLAFYLWRLARFCALWIRREKFCCGVRGPCISSLFELVSGILSELRKPATPSMGVQAFFRLFCGVCCIFVGSENVDLRT